MTLLFDHRQALRLVIVSLIVAGILFLLLEAGPAQTLGGSGPHTRRPSLSSCVRITRAVVYVEIPVIYPLIAALTNSRRIRAIF